MKMVDYREIRKLFDEEYKRKMQLIRDGETHLDIMAEGFVGADKVIFNLPEVDAVPVVRCKDCKHWRVGLDRTNTWCARMNGMETIEDDFCNYGERRNDA